MSTEPLCQPGPSIPLFQALPLISRLLHWLNEATVIDAWVLITGILKTLCAIKPITLTVDRHHSVMCKLNPHYFIILGTDIPLLRMNTHIRRQLQEYFQTTFLTVQNVLHVSAFWQNHHQAQAQLLMPVPDEGCLSIVLLYFSRSQWPRALRRGSEAVRLLGLRVRIPPGAWMSVSCKCCVWSGRGLCVGLITRPEESYWVRSVWVWSWSLDNKVLGPLRAVPPWQEKKNF
jgi:hypothetical protein